ncbi:MAG: cytochrome c [Saprospiraceae bacterium]|nr:cytochrome c [Saprospiraceae bacterium]
MKGFLYLVIWALAFAFSCSSAPANATPDPAEGEALYRKYCALCHGADGRKGFNGAPDLTLSTLKREERIRLIGDGKGQMAPYKELLTPAQIEQIADFTLTLR